jgi:hypothetical protein
MQSACIQVCMHTISACISACIGMHIGMPTLFLDFMTLFYLHWQFRGHFVLGKIIFFLENVFLSTIKRRLLFFEMFFRKNLTNFLRLDKFWKFWKNHFLKTKFLFRRIKTIFLQKKQFVLFKQKWLLNCSFSIIESSTDSIAFWTSFLSNALSYPTLPMKKDTKKGTTFFYLYFLWQME